jgi:CDP-diacylglycerol---glycerol-3-phosphate 3-phosphatidyltransferase
MLTSSRFVLSPLFAIVFILLDRLDGFEVVGVSLLWIILVLIELSDVLDGAVARRSDTVSDIGKILDPFADVVSKVTYFAVLLVAGVVPLWFLLVVLYREFGIILIRMILFRDGIALAAHLLGKLKTWFYGMTAAAGLLFLSRDILAGEPVRMLVREGPPWQVWTMHALTVVTATLCVGSFARYLVVFVRERRKGGR